MKTIFVILLGISLPLITQANIVITEIMYNLPGADDKREWIEVVNTGPVRNLPDWKFFENEENHGIKYVQGGILSDGQVYTNEYVVIAEDAGQFLVDNPGYQGKLFDSVFSLHNTGETISIRASWGDITDEVTYSSSWGAQEDGNSLQKTESGWIASTSTPGRATAVEGDSEPTEVTVVTGILESDTVWSPSNGTYVLDGAVTVSASSTLTIEPGTVVKVKTGGSGVLNVHGTLAAGGTDVEKVYFTSYFDDSVGGDTDGIGEMIVPLTKDWQGIYFKEESTGNLENVVVRYAGYGEVGYGRSTSIDNDGGIINLNKVNLGSSYGNGVSNFSGTTTISNSNIDGYITGVFAQSGSVSVSGTNITTSSDYGVYALGESTVLNLDFNIFSGNKYTAYVEASVDFAHSGNTSSDLLQRGFERTGYARNGSVWHTNDLPTINGGGIFVPAGDTLSLQPGFVMKMKPSVFIDVEGMLLAQGTELEPIYFVPLKDDSVAGDTNGDGALTSTGEGLWTGVSFREGSVGNLTHVVIRHAGGLSGPSYDSQRSGLFNFGGDVTLDNVEFRENVGSHIYQKSGELTVTETNFGPHNYGVIVMDGVVTISHSNFGVSNAIDNRSASSTVDVRSNWWGSELGPRVQGGPDTGNTWIYGSVLYDPWIRRDPALPNPVIIVPGMMGSELRNKSLVINNLIWPDIVKTVTYVNDDFLDVLKLENDGTSGLEDIVIGDVVRSLNDSDYFEGLIADLWQQQIREENELFVFPYDWRMDISETSYELNKKIEEIKTITGATEVDIVAHSMGGLIVKEYIKSHNINSIAKFVDIATPHNGAPSANKVLTYGDNLGVSRFFGIIGVNAAKIKEISQNMPAVYQLLPSRSYFDDSNNDYSYYVLDTVGGANRLSYDQTKDYMKSSGRNAQLVDRADEFHQEIDGLDPADYGVETYNIVGCGTPTIGQFYILAKDGDHYNYNIRMINGDGTVPLKSAEALPANKTYYVKGVQHAVLPSAYGVKELVSSILTGDSYDISYYSNVVATVGECPIPDGRIVSFHSPIELHVYDELGNHVGPNNDGDIENNISGVVYEQIEDNKFAFLPEGQTYQIAGASTGSGTFDVRIEEMEGGEVVQTSIFSDIPLTETTQTNFDIGVSVPNQIYLDADGDDSFEGVFNVSTTTNGFLESTGAMIQENVEPEPESESELETEQAQVVTIVATSVSHGGSRSVIQSVRREEPVQSVVTDVAVRPVGPIGPIGQIGVVNQAEQEVAVSTTSDNTKNIATVYKSIGGKVKGFFKSIWRWFISKL